MTRPPVGLDRLVERPHHGLARRLPGPREPLRRCVRPVTVIASPLRQPASSRRLRDQADAAGFVEVVGDVLAAGLHVGDQRRLLADAVEVVDVELDAGFAGDGQEVQHGVGRAAGRA